MLGWTGVPFPSRDVVVVVVVERCLREMVDAVGRRSLALSLCQPSDLPRMRRHMCCVGSDLVHLGEDSWSQLRKRQWTEVHTEDASNHPVAKVALWGGDHESYRVDLSVREGLCYSPRLLRWNPLEVQDGVTGRKVGRES